MTIRMAVAIALLGLTTAAGAQGPGSGVSGSGTGADGSKPADGAITGGTLRKEPGTEGGTEAGTSAAPAGAAARRCNELSGSLREECLAKEQAPAAGGTRAPSPRTAPPPQNPR